MADDLKQVQTELKQLTGQIQSLTKKVEEIHEEIGAKTGRELGDQMDTLERDIDQIKREVAAIKVDTSNIRSTQEYRGKVTEDIKKALAAIYKNTDELERNLLPSERETY